MSSTRQYAMAKTAQLYRSEASAAVTYFARVGPCHQQRGDASAKTSYAAEGNIGTATLQRLFGDIDHTAALVRVDTLQWILPSVFSLLSRDQGAKAVTPAIRSTLLEHELPLP
jgi:hypothetical protein